jgi:hypothetical protein
MASSNWNKAAVMLCRLPFVSGGAHAFFLEWIMMVIAFGVAACIVRTCLITSMSRLYGPG